jgi:CMP-N,N'-diacetyllegionaminic acid synthase
VIDSKSFLAIITARGGSRRLPRKNILNLGGRAMISWTIEAALKSKYIDHVIVSTDDQEISDISKECNADVPFIRPIELATDSATSVDVVLHSIEELENNNKYYDYVILLQPTSPFRNAKNIDDSIDLLISKRSDAVISVCESSHSPLWCNTIPDTGDLSKFMDISILNKRSQELKKYFCLNGAIYLCNIKKLRQEKTFFLSKNCMAYKMNKKQSIDIDDEYDFTYAKALLSMDSNFE